MKLTPLAAALLSTIAAASVHAQTTATQEIVVTTDRGRADLELQNLRNPFRTPASSQAHVQTITREEIEQLRAPDVFEAINMASGVVATPRSSRMGFSSLSLRGDSNFRWMIDGIYLDAGTGSRIMSSIPLAAIEEIKIVRGSSALTFGPMTNTENPSGGAAVDGFIVVRTRKPQKDEAQARVAVESNAGREQNLWVGKKLASDNKAYLAALVAHGENGNPSDMLDNGKSYNTARNADKGFLRGGIELAGWAVDLMAYKDKGSYQIPNTNSHITSAGNKDWFVDPSETTLVGLSGHRVWDERNTTLFSLSNVDVEQVVHSRGKTDVSPLTEQTPNVINATHYNLKHVLSLDIARMTAGMDYRRWAVPNGQNPAYYPGIRREEVTRGWFVQAERDLMDGRLSLDGSVRQDNVYQVHGLNFLFTGVGQNGTVASTQINNVQLPNALFWTMGSRYKLTPDWSLLARYGQGNQPLTTEMKAAPGVTLARDAQSKLEVGAQGRLNASTQLALNYFYREAQNEKKIAAYMMQAGSCTDTKSAPTVDYFVPCYGQGDTTRAGLEAVLSGDWAQAGRYRVSWTHFTRLAGTINNAPLSVQTPANLAELMLSHPMGAFTWTGAAKYVSQYIGTANGTVGQAAYSGGYTKLDAGLSYDWRFGSTKMRTGIYGRNLTDKKFETATGIQDVGRVVGIEQLIQF
jgi:outer membrane cobalamin receptor